MLSKLDTPKHDGEAPLRARRAADASVLESIRRRDTNIALWRRRSPLASSRLAAHLGPFGALWKDEHDTRASTLVEWASLAPDAEVARVLREDFARLGALFVRLSDEPRFRATFGVVATNKCRKFHADYVRLRLIVTYVGPGTEWVPDAAVRRGALLDSPADADEANRLIVRDPEEVGRARPGDVLLLKGHTWAGNEGRGAVHRSPPVEERGMRRLVLILTAGSAAP